MTKNHLVPLKMDPFLRDTIWGGHRLATDYGKKPAATLKNVAESWEVSTHPNGLNKICDGAFAGDTFANYLASVGPKVISSHAKNTDFPLIIKYIDAMDNLSIQVHPGPGYAAPGPNATGKTEMWYVVDAKPGSSIYYGVKEITDRRIFKQHIQDDTLPKILRQVPAKPGDVFFLPPGTLHGIGKGLLIAEIQQSCDLTYRVCDYGRVDFNGKKRPLHIKDALAVSNLNPTPDTIPKPTETLARGNQAQLLVKCDYFTVTRFTLQASFTDAVKPSSFHVLMCLEGQFQITHQQIIYTFAKGETAYLPAGMGDYTLDGHATILKTTL